MWAHSVNKLKQAPFNQFHHNTKLVDASFSGVVTPNNDTLYSTAWLDLRAEPYVLSLPEIPDKRYYSMQFVDYYTYNFSILGSRNTGYCPGNYLVAAPKWEGEVPPGVVAIPKPQSEYVFLLGRTEVFGEDDIPNVEKIQSGYILTPLSNFVSKPAPEPIPEPRFPVVVPKDFLTPAFFGYINFIMQYVEIDPSEVDLFKLFALIGVIPGQPFDEKTMDPATLEAIQTGITQGNDLLNSILSSGKSQGGFFQKLSTARGLMRQMENVTPVWSQRTGFLREVSGYKHNGWVVPVDPPLFGPKEVMQGKYLLRAMAARVGLYGLDPAEAFYPRAQVDSNSDPLDSSTNSYVLKFAQNQIPDVKGFWSLTMYRLPENLFVPNPINRYSLGDRSKSLKYGSDGSLTIYLQKENPGTEKESNWLPGPDGLFAVVLRLYWPSEKAVKDPYIPPTIARL